MVFNNLYRYRADTKLRSGKLQQALGDVKMAMELDSKNSSLFRYAISVMRSHAGQLEIAEYGMSCASPG